MDDIYRVFFHELGHFVARSLNKEYFNGPPILSIEIFLANGNLNLYSGELKVDTTGRPDEKDIPNKKRLPIYLASSTYGCFFQAIYLNQLLNDCFNRNGHDDYSKWYETLSEHRLDDKKSEFLNAEMKYLEILKNDPELMKLTEINPFEFIYSPSEDASNYFVDISALNEKLNSFINNHYPLYKSLIEEYQEIIRQSH